MIFIRSKKEYETALGSDYEFRNGLIKVKDLPGEKWRDIPYCSIFQASNLGRIKRNTFEAYYPKLKGTRFYDEHLCGLYPDKRGYLRVRLQLFDFDKNYKVSRLVYFSFYGVPENEKEVQINHINESEKWNNRLDNLESCNVKYNVNYGTRTERATETNRKKGNYQRLSELTRKRMLENNPYAKKVVCDGIEFKSIAQCARYYDVKYGTMKSWLSQKRKMPDKYMKMGLKFADKQ